MNGIRQRLQITTAKALAERIWVDVPDLISALDFRTILSDSDPRRGNDFIRGVRRYAREHGLAFEWRPDLGKGSHGVLIIGTRRTVVRDPKSELKAGTLHAMLKQLDLTPDDIR